MTLDMIVRDCPLGCFNTSIPLRIESNEEKANATNLNLLYS